MLKHKAKVISNFLKICIVAYLFFEYHFQSIQKNAPLSSDDCKGLLYIGIAAFLILFPIDASIFIKNFQAAKNLKINDKETKE